MLFNSLAFILVFLPLVLALFHAARNPKVKLLVLLTASLFFYGWWNPVYLPLLVFSVATNWCLAGSLARNKSRAVLGTGIAINLALIGFFKYAQLIVDSAYHFSDQESPALNIVLPLAISFYTFQQISFLVDCYFRRTEPGRLLEYSAYVTFFPQLIAGPIVRHTELVPQFRNQQFSPRSQEICQALTLFSLGLFKKVVFADALGSLNRPYFEAVSDGTMLSLTQAWWAVSTYALQLYYDFSAYSDMAIGLALLFGFRLPMNFRSPYQATSIQEFWKRWHITLTAFFTQYLYLPLSLRLRVRTLKGHAAITLLVMAIVGLWHGAGWNFVIWGLIHGGYLVISRVYSHYRKAKSDEPKAWAPLGVLGRLKVFVLLAVSYPFFRVAEFGPAVELVKSLFRLIPGAAVPNEALLLSSDLVISTTHICYLGALLAILWWAPSAVRLSGVDADAEAGLIDRWRARMPALIAGFIVGFVFAFSLIRIYVGYESEFLYFQF